MISISAVNVHLVGGDPWWHGLIGPALGGLLAATTAVAAAVIAARTANHRQQEQLAHDRQLQAKQLAHDREQRNRQKTIDVIDEAVKRPIAPSGHWPATQPQLSWETSLVM